MTLCRTTKQNIHHCKCSRCHPHKELSYAHVQRKVEQRPKGTL